MENRNVLTIQFSGFGGQGIVLSSLIFGSAAVLEAGFNAVQTSSYGSEARGGQCQAELILSKDEILSPTSASPDILVCMSQIALNTYLDRLPEGKVLVIDPDMAERPSRTDITIIEVPATTIATDLGLRISANMVVLGFLQEYTSLISREILFLTIKNNVPTKFLDTNIEAATKGIELAKKLQAETVR